VIALKRLGWFAGLFGVAALAQLTWLVFADGRAPEKPGEFRFARLRYPGRIRGYVKNWDTDYPAMDDNLTALLRRLTIIDVAEPALVPPSSKTIFQYPLIYSVEPEQMNLTPEDAANLSEYLARGGFWFADDFHGDEELNQFLEQVDRVVPEASIVELNTSHPLFHSFYDINEIIQVTNDGIAKCAECNQWENGESGKIPRVFAVLDGSGRISILMAWNTDLGDGLEWADDPRYPSRYSKYAFKFMTNVIVYAMSH
jgi:hypothetical protein